MILPSSTTAIDMETDPRLGGLAPSSMHTKAQILRSVSSWSSGVEKTEHSIMDAYVDLIGASEHFVYIGKIDKTKKNAHSLVSFPSPRKSILHHLNAMWNDDDRKQDWRCIV
jgi:hypothetical protein